MNRRGIKPQAQVSTQWSPDLAYAIGLLATDGCLSKDGYHIDFTSADKDQVKTFQKCLGLHHIKIGEKTAGVGKTKKYYRLQFGDIMLYRWLMDLGLSPNKSKTLGELKIPNEVFFDFLRGCWDGDGSIHAFWDRRWKSSYVFALSFTGASPKFLAWIQNRLRYLIDVGGYLSQGVRCYQLRFAKRDSKLLFEKMFYAENLPYLKRKFTKVQKILKIDAQH